MIVTHSNKFLLPKSKLIGCIKKERLDIPDFLLSSNLATKSKKYWINPSSAAYYKEAKIVADEANLNGADNSFPAELDGYSKQLFLKTKNGYIAHTPLTACNLVDEFTNKAKSIYFKKKNEHINCEPFIIQQRSLTLANRGELAVNHGGKFWVKSLDLSKESHSNKSVINLPAEREYLYFYGRADDVNINGGFISKGLPSLSAIGGIAELIELKLGYSDSIPFAFGVKNLCQTKKGNKGTSFKNGKLSPVLVVEEAKGSFDFVLVLDVTCFNYDEIARELKNIHRLAGGSIFDYNITKDKPINNEYVFIKSNKKAMEKALDNGDPISYIIENDIYPILCGYALLEKPIIKKGVRLNNLRNESNLHAFSEDIFLPISLTNKLNNRSFFERKVLKHCTIFI